MLFVDYIAEHLNPNGRAAIIVPEGIVFQSANAYKELRKYLVNNDLLYAVISLPAGVFNPYSGVKTSILLIDKSFARLKDEILFVKLNNDGFDLGAQRREIKENDIPEIIHIVKKYHTDLEPQTADDEIRQHPLVTIASKEEVAARDYILVGERYKNCEFSNAAFPMVQLDSICQTASGGTPNSSTREYYENGTINWLKSGEVSQGLIYSAEQKITEIGLKNSSAKIFPVDTVLVAMYGATAGQVGLLKVESATNQAICGILPSDRIIPQFLFYLLKEKKDFLIEQSTGGAQPNISQKIIRNLRIPLPPLSVQKDIVAELDSYQKIIDGAQQIIDNYRPTIRIDPTWEKVKLGDICNLTYGYTDTAKESGSARFVRITDIDEKGLLRDENKRYVDLIEQNKVFLLHRGDLLVARTGATFGKTLYFDTDEVAVFASFLIKLDLPEYIDHYFYWIFAQTQNYWDQANSLVSGGAQPQFNANAIKQLVMPIPPLDIQKSIIKQAREELEIIDANKKLISIFKQKIADKISEVWGK